MRTSRSKALLSNVSVESRFFTNTNETDERFRSVQNSSDQSLFCETLHASKVLVALVMKHSAKKSLLDYLDKSRALEAGEPPKNSARKSRKMDGSPPATAPTRKLRNREESKENSIRKDSRKYHIYVVL